MSTTIRAAPSAAAATAVNAIRNSSAADSTSVLAAAALMAGPIPSAPVVSTTPLQARPPGLASAGTGTGSGGGSGGSGGAALSTGSGGGGSGSGSGGGGPTLPLLAVASHPIFPIVLKAINNVNSSTYQHLSLSFPAIQTLHCTALHCCHHHYQQAETSHPTIAPIT